MVVRLLLSEVYQTLYAYGQNLKLSSKRKLSTSEIERMALERLEELDSELLHCLLCFEAAELAKSGCLDGYRSIQGNSKQWFEDEEIYKIIFQKERNAI